ncbi:PREDICTED: C-C chemokine receptor type 6-like [Poecilia mexicana]|uniref:G-protein coupled receptors family 1 profile domain-containing protein n=1 Tax=Poecilia mexicana TaxID=48701 RepID=A0A3B3WZB8_9TELE|nr:PREDICTED: C-C chemokine receptor type 6-like [Poecilia mexicana]
MEDSAVIQGGFNASEEEELHEPCRFSSSNSMNWLLSSYIYSIICILGLVGNVVIIITLTCKTKNKLKTYKTKNKLKIHEVFQLNLAITNLLFTVALAFLIYNELYSWPMGQATCKLLQGSYSINLYSGMLLVAGMSVLHFVSLCRPLYCQTNSIEMKHTFIICVSIWVFALLLSVPTFYFYQLYVPTSETIHMLEGENHSNSSASPQFVCEFQFEDHDLSQIVKVAVPSVQMAVGFFLPLLVIIVCYTSIIIKLLTKKFIPTNRKSKKEMKEPLDPNNTKSKDNLTGAVKTVMGIMLVFVACHLPHNLVLLYDTSTMFQLVACEEADRLHTALSVTEFIAYLQCCLNPVMYGFIGKNFRQKFRKTFFSTNKSENGYSRYQSSTKSTKSGSFKELCEDAHGSDVEHLLSGLVQREDAL